MDYSIIDFSLKELLGFLFQKMLDQAQVLREGIIYSSYVHIRGLDEYAIGLYIN
jgi:hypothetical protein